MVCVRCFIVVLPRQSICFVVNSLTLASFRPANLFIWGRRPKRLRTHSMKYTFMASKHPCRAPKYYLLSKYSECCADIFTGKTFYFEWFHCSCTTNRSLWLALNCFSFRGFSSIKRFKIYLEITMNLYWTGSLSSMVFFL